jgi:hypothetical protein
MGKSLMQHAASELVAIDSRLGRGGGTNLKKKGGLMKGERHPDYLVITINSGEKLQAPDDEEGQRQHWLVCAGCGSVEARTWNAVSFRCKTCWDERVFSEVQKGESKNV